MEPPLINGRDDFPHHQRKLLRRPDTSWPKVPRTGDRELMFPTPITVIKVVGEALIRLLHEPSGIVMAATILLLMLWGGHGGLQLLGPAVFGQKWVGPGHIPPTPGAIIPSIPWDQELISFAAGCILLVLFPILAIKFVFKRSLSSFGLGLPARNRWGLTLYSTLLLAVVAVIAVVLSTRDPAMQKIYPIYRGDFSEGGLKNFALYELAYLMFFIAIEFIFRGFLLFGLYQATDADSALESDGEKGRLLFGYLAILVSMLSYTAWHLSKPVSECFGTLFWGIVTGAIVLTCRTIWHVVLIHWLMNVAMDWCFISMATES